MIRPLLAGFYLPKGHMGVGGSLQKHPFEILFVHEVGTGAGSQIPAPGQQLHGPAVDLLIAPVGIFSGIAALGKGRGIQNDIIVCPALLFAQFRKQFKYIPADKLQLQPVEPGIGGRFFYGCL